VSSQYPESPIQIWELGRVRCGAAAARQPDGLGDAGGGNFTIVGQYLLGLLPDDTSPY
jgi:hypothetical protein